jgi:hypothetical protein
MLYPVPKLGGCVSSENPAGLGPWAGLERADGMTLVHLAWLTALCPTGPFRGAPGVVSGYLSCDPSRPKPSPSDKRENPCAATSFVQSHQLCSSLALPI